MDNITRVTRLTPAELESEFLSRERAVVLTDVLGGWPGTPQWSLERLRLSQADRVLRLRGGSRTSWRILTRVKAPEYFDYLEATPEERAGHALAPFAHLNPYAAFNSVEPGLRDGLRFQDLVPAKYALGPTMLWIGPARSLTPLHYDASGISMLAQFVGRKRFTLFPFDESRYLYPSDVFDYQSVFSAVNLDSPDQRAHPRFGLARPIEVELHPGELLVFPNRMWHQVQAVDNSVSVTRRMMTPAEKLHPRMIWWKLKALAHLTGVYKRGRCLCHIDELTPADLSSHPALIRYLVRRSGKAHGRDLAELVGWVR